MKKIESDVVEEIPTSKHVFICGMPGTGKSFLAEHYLAGYEYVVKLDTKDETDERLDNGEAIWDGVPQKDLSVVRALDDLYLAETKKIVYVPPYEEQDEEHFNAFFNFCFERQNTLIWIDELMSIGTPHRYPRGLGRVYTQGRSKNVGVWACSQRPSSVPAIATANSTYFFIFDLPLLNDRKRLVDATGMEEILELPHGNNFWYYKLGDSYPVKAVLEI